MDFNEINLEEELKKLKYEEDCITLNNVFPIKIAEALNGTSNDIDIIGGRDLDYEGNFGNYYINGSAFYGSCSIYLKNGLKKPEEELIKKETESIYPIRENVSEEELKELLEKGILKKFYLFHFCNGPYNIFYAKNEWDAREKALELWGSYNNIRNEEEMQEYFDFYKKLPESHKPVLSNKNSVLILDWEYKSN